MMTAYTSTARWDIEDVDTRAEEWDADEAALGGEQPALRQRPGRRPTAMYALLAVAAVAVVGAIQLAISITLAQGSYEIASLTNESAQLSRTTQSLQETITVRESPQYLAKQAHKLGMTSSANTTFVRLSDGKKVKTVKTLSAAWQRIADSYAITVSGNRIANSNLSNSSSASSETTSAVSGVKDDLESAFGSLLSLAPSTGTSTATTATESTSTTSDEAAQANPPMTSTRGGTQTSGSAENAPSNGVASGSESTSDLSLGANQMPAPQTR